MVPFSPILCTHHVVRSISPRGAGLDINVRSLKDLTAFVLKHAKKAVKLGLSDEAMAKEDEASAAAAATRAAAGAVSEDDEDYDDELETDADAPDDEEEDTKTEL